MAFSDPEPGPGALAAIGGVGLGCLFLIVLLFPIVIFVAMGDSHCEPVPDCRPGLGAALLRGGLLALGPAILLGAAFRSLFHWLGRRITAQEAEPDTAPRARTPWWAVAAVPLAIAAGTWLVWGEPFWRLW